MKRSFVFPNTDGHCRIYLDTTPTRRNDGTPLQGGDEWIDKTNFVAKIYNGSSFVAGDSAFDDAAYTGTLTLSGSKTYGINISGAPTTGLRITTSATGIDIGAGTTALKVTGNTGATLNAAPAAGGYGLKIHTHANTNNSGGVAPNDVTYINEFKGEFLSTSGTMIGIGADYTLSGTGTGAMCANYGYAKLLTGITLSGSAWPAVGVLTGGQFFANVAGVLNGTAVLVTGLYGGIEACTGGTLTVAKYMSAIWGDWKSTVDLGTGDSSILLLTNSATGNVDYGIYLKNESTGAIATGICIARGVTSAAIRVGAWKASQATGNAVVLATTMSDGVDTGQLDVVSVFAESIADLTGAYSAKAGRFRHLVSAGADTDFNQETYGLIGQLVVKNASFGHYHAGIMGTFETNTLCHIKTSYCAAGISARLGGSGTTVDSGGLLAGFAAIQHMSAFTATAGIMAGFATHKTTVGLAWPIGLYMPVGSVSVPIQIGVKANTSGSGLVLAGDTDNSGGVQIYCDDGGVAAVGDVLSPLRCRYLLSLSQTGGKTQCGSFSQLRILDSLSMTNGGFRAAYIFNQIGNSFTLSGTAEATTINAATTIGTGNLTVNSGCSFTGIDINIAGTGTIVNSGTSAALLIRSSGTPVWPYGIYMPVGSAENGIKIGAGTGASGLVLTAAANYGMAVYMTCADGTGTSINSTIFDTTLTGAGGCGGRMYVHMSTNVVLGGWANALKAQVDCNTNGRASGLLSAFCAEIVLPASNVSGLAGTYAALEAEINCATNCTPNHRTSFLFMGTGGNSTAITAFQDVGCLFEIVGIGAASSATNIFHTTGSVSATHGLRCRIDNVDYDILLKASTYA